MARNRRRNSRARKGGFSVGSIIATVALSAVALAMVGTFGWLKYRAMSNVTLDKASLCPVTGPTSETAILLDVTDPISEPTSLDLKNQFQALASGIPVGGAIDIFALTEKEGSLENTFHGCNPGSGELADEWTSNPRLVQERWEKGFQKPLDDIAGKLGKGATGEFSPIMAGIQRINLQAFQRLPASISKTLYIASDMIEHTPAFSSYRDGVSITKFESSPAREKFRTSLDGVRVKILAFQRPGQKFKSEDLAAFWKSWIESNSGEFAGFTRLEGLE
ncbi:hypothetical protein ELH42_37805 [Rhizobium ruizarguesonis]|uniref:hypothetical protein n=1 Tax=Rhizobium ruizarguesonis TaxID=2081791 RepID=UPI001032259C|nr:hypothetical protein [Rhizobium ruizarguesonis]TBB57045.1 hypothetical protein ELH42_37805 [Rhizobium ruizarguesonis]